MQITGVQTGYLGTSTWIVPVADSCGGAFFVTDPGGDSRDAQRIIKTLNRLAAASHSAADASTETGPAQKAGPRVAGFVLTHGHFDHVGALPFLHKAFPDAPIAIHSGDAAYLGPAAGRLHIEDFTALDLADYVEQTLDGNPLPEATVLLADGGVLPFAPEWKILHTPGHSPGSICLYNEAAATSPMKADGSATSTDRADSAATSESESSTSCGQSLLSDSERRQGIRHILLSGDTLFDGTCGRTDLRGGSDIQMRHSLTEIVRRVPERTIVLPGHGGPFMNWTGARLP